MRGRAPLRVAIIGMGGFAQQHHRTLHRLEEEGACCVVATCDPRPDLFAAEMDERKFARRSIRVYSDHLQMLDAHRQELDLVTVPTPIPLHAPMHRACVERGFACYLEKPPTLCYKELDEMLAVEAGAAKQTQVAFSFIAEEPRRVLKTRLLRGDFGRIRRVGLIGFWPRATRYFTRSPWAGRLIFDGRPVLDSCVGNALAHYVHNLLFWCGRDGLYSWETVASVESELYRAHAIESFDTCFARGRGTSGVEIYIAATHAGKGQQYQREIVECEAATITYVTGDTYRVDWRDGRREIGQADRRDLVRVNFQTYFDYLRGDIPRPLTRLIDARPFVHFYDLILVAGKSITNIRGDLVERLAAPEGGGEYVAISGVGEACEAFIETGLFPAAQGRPWAKTGGQAFTEELPYLRPVVRQMIKANSSQP